MSSCVLPISYIPPLESPYFNEDSFSILEGEINHFYAQRHVLVCGDLNARTGQEPDTLSTISEQQIQSLLDNFLDKTFHCNSEGVNLAVENLNRIFDLSASQ